MLYEPPWQYYVKYKRFLHELSHPFASYIDFYIDKNMGIGEDVLAKYKAVAFFYHDPLKQLYPPIYEYAKKIQVACVRNNISFLNDPDSLSLSTKSIQLALLAQHGFKVAKAYSFEEWHELLDNKSLIYPLFVRYDCGHDSLGEGYSGPFYSQEELENSSTWEGRTWKESKHLKGFVAIEWLDTRSPDGLYRKYRVFVFGDYVIRGPLQISRHWFVHGNNVLSNDKMRQEAECFLLGECSKEEESYFLNVNEVLGLDFSAIDYSYDASGKVVIWEANPHPSLGDWAENNLFKSKFTENLSHFYNSKIT